MTTATLERDCVAKFLVHCDERTYVSTVTPSTWRGRPAFTVYSAFVDAYGTHELRRLHYADLACALDDHASGLRNLGRLGTVETIIAPPSA